jgi:hypothetical protein
MHGGMQPLEKHVPKRWQLGCSHTQGVAPWWARLAIIGFWLGFFLAPLRFSALRFPVLCLFDISPCISCVCPVKH